MGQIQKLSILASIGECKNLSKSLISLFFFFLKDLFGAISKIFA